MFSNALKQFKTALALLAVLALLTGIIYPILVTLIAQLFFPWQANGSLLNQNGKRIGSALIGQTFTDPKYFWGRPSATSPNAYNAANSTGSNLGPLNPQLFSDVTNRIKTLREADPENQNLIPVDLVTASASGLDPEISPLAALYQARRIAKARGLQEREVQILIQLATRHRTFNVLGEPRVNVLELNMALDHMKLGSA